MRELSSKCWRLSWEIQVKKHETWCVEQMIQYLGGGSMIRFTESDRTYGCFSNFYPCAIKYQDMDFLNSEAAYQAMKTGDPEARKQFTGLTGKEAKKLGGKLTSCTDWDAIKFLIMVDICYAKFSQNLELKWILLGTGHEELVEDTTGWHDNIWGDCSCEYCKTISGQNLLGKALMKVRSKLREELKEQYFKLLKYRDIDDYFERMVIDEAIVACEYLLQL